MFDILVVEDDKNVRSLVCSILKDAGYNYYAAENGLEALNVMDEHHVDLAVVDIMMPEMDGYEFTETLRSCDCELPVLMLTAKISHEDKKKGFGVGADDFLPKPFDEEELLADRSSFAPLKNCLGKAADRWKNNARLRLNGRNLGWEKGRPLPKGVPAAFPAAFISQPPFYEASDNGRDLGL